MMILICPTSSAAADAARMVRVRRCPAGARGPAATAQVRCASVIEAHHYLLRGTRGEREFERTLRLREWDAMADQPGEARRMLGDILGDLEDLSGVSL